MTSSAMDGLIAFLRERYDEEHALAEIGDLRSPDLTLRLDDDECWVSVTPARIIAEVEAKRRIVDEFDAAFDRTRRHPGDVATSADFLAMVRVVKLLALPYNCHDDYREEWRP